MLYSLASRREVSRYLQIFSSATHFAVLKVGGAILTHELESLTLSLNFLHRVGLYPVVVHGMGDKLNARLEADGIVPDYIDGQSRASTASGLTLTPLHLQVSVSPTLVPFPTLDESSFRKISNSYPLSKLSALALVQSPLVSSPPNTSINLVTATSVVSLQSTRNLSRLRFVPELSPSSLPSLKPQKVKSSTSTLMSPLPNSPRFSNLSRSFT